MNAPIRELTREIAATRDANPFDRHCAYCGARCFGYACAAHVDLMRLEQSATQEGGNR